MFPDFELIETPFYFYDMELLDKTLKAAIKESNRYGYQIHYALKANTNEQLLKHIAQHGLGADCVSGNEIIAARSAGFPKKTIVFAGVGKTDKEINIALDNDIFCINCESLQELDVLDKLAGNKKKSSLCFWKRGRSPWLIR